MIISGSAFVVGMVIATLYGALFHFIRGGGLGRLFFDILLSWLGFWIGHFAGIFLNFPVYLIGSLALGMATLGSLLFLLIGNWLSVLEPPEET